MLLIIIKLGNIFKLENHSSFQQMQLQLKTMQQAKKSLGAF